ncbi:MAG: DUF481 domain-containing protein [Phaeodactylibacter xiamenensis]|uniref:DUF481 domain-containing protein n=1 Tax=Phaeodactylibacter xiamenensis TaxID=1524460 RepID=A0A098SA10_9BACT|nr:DUF481 domain-containing protein [Phaeodactylibacter xiamenensis]KGE88488.1 hypothetical protein IX84_07285 [Phaeodactylibacter xiamenensis]MCR9054609.1 DUF481 domain-containing protein [bacterium]
MQDNRTAETTHIFKIFGRAYPKPNFLLALLCLAFVIPSVLPGQSQDRLKLFIDCNCDRNYLVQEITYLDHVRDQGQANIQLFIFDIWTGAGGRSFTLNFKGQGAFEGLEQELKFESNPNMTNSEVRDGLLRTVNQGLLHYLVNSELASHIDFQVNVPEGTGTAGAEENKDPWNYWIFEVSGNGRLYKESSREEFSVDLGVDIDRVTDAWRVRIDGQVSHAENQFESDDEMLVSVRKWKVLSGSIVKSITDHWSTGVFSGIRQSTFNNIAQAYNFHPALEYNIFPYEEVLRREITFAYRIGFQHQQYFERTVFGQIEENLLNHSLDIQLRFRQPWGDIFTTLQASSFLHDMSKNRVEFDNWIAVRLYEGLALRFSANFDLVSDQINLPEGDTSVEDILLQQRQIATDFAASTGLGLSYTFGSTLNNIVNTRL